MGFVFCWSIAFGQCSDLWHGWYPGMLHWKNFSSISKQVSMANNFLHGMEGNLSPFLLFYMHPTLCPPVYLGIMYRMHSRNYSSFKQWAHNFLFFIYYLFILFYFAAKKKKMSFWAISLITVQVT